MLGNGRLEALCFDGEKRLAHIRGKLRKKVWINQGDIILLSLRDYQDEKGDVILKYSADEARSLKAYGELPETAKINETDTYEGFASQTEGLRADLLVFLGMVMRVWMIMLNSTRTETTAATTRISTSMRSESLRGHWVYQLHSGWLCWRSRNTKKRTIVSQTRIQLQGGVKEAQKACVKGWQGTCRWTASSTDCATYE